MREAEPIPPILVSACLADVRCRYDGRSKPDKGVTSGKLRVLPLCPEVAGGLGVPREAAEIRGGDGDDVLDGAARVVTRSGRDVTAEFVRGAHAVLAVASHAGVKKAILKARSPSCGFDRVEAAEGTSHETLGVTAALLRRHGIKVLSDEEWNSKTL